MSSSYKQVLLKLRKDIEGALEKEVAEDMKKKHKTAVDEDVYAAYNPTAVYERRYDMYKDENISVEASGLSVTLKNVTPPNDAYGGDTSVNLSEVVETGVGYKYPNPGPRPFIQGTADRIQAENSHIKAMKEGLQNRGWDVS